MGQVTVRTQKIMQRPTNEWRPRDTMKKAFYVPRRKELLDLEGWYSCSTTIHGTRFKLSCRFNDILRAADSKHYGYSCFRPQGGSCYQPIKRLQNPDWAVVFRVDNAGAPEARCWVYWNDTFPGGALCVCPRQGTKLLNFELIKLGFENSNLSHNVCVLEERNDIYL